MNYHKLSHRHERNLVVVVDKTTTITDNWHATLRNNVSSHVSTQRNRKKEGKKGNFTQNTHTKNDNMSELASQMVNNCVFVCVFYMQLRVREERNRLEIDYRKKAEIFGQIVSPVRSSLFGWWLSRSPRFGRRKVNNLLNSTVLSQRWSSFIFVGNEQRLNDWLGNRGRQTEKSIFNILTREWLAPLTGSDSLSERESEGHH